jgi:hypothetical protein
MNSQTIKTIVAYFWSPSVAELITKVLEAEGENDFFEKEKVKFMQMVCQEIKSIKEEPAVEKCIENFGLVIDSLVEKHEDKYERSKYAALLKKIIEEPDNFLFLLGHLEKYGSNNAIKTELLKCIYSFLRIHEPAKSGSKIHELEANPAEIIHLNPQFL